MPKRKKKVTQGGTLMRMEDGVSDHARYESLPDAHCDGCESVTGRDLSQAENLASEILCANY